MKAKADKKSPLLLEGELLLEKGKKIVRSKIEIKILDITHIDTESVVLAESIKEIEVLTVKNNQIRIPFEVLGPAPDPSRNYIVVASISAEDRNGDKKTLYRTTQSIPVFKDGYPDVVKVPLTKMD